MKRKRTIEDDKNKKVKFRSVEEKIIDHILEGKSVFITGVAGTGKSHLILGLPDLLEEKTTKSTAMTGIASINIKGSTLHKFTGTGIETDFEKMLKRVKKGMKSIQDWKDCDVLIIDEVSMMGENFFDNLEKLARRIRGNDEFFGGIQLILVGDFFQLPPIKDEFLFKSEVFKENITNYFELTHNYRQTDENFKKILHEVRYGEVTPESIKILIELTNKKYDETVEPVKLYSTRVNVDDENNKELAKIKSPLVQFECSDFVKMGNSTRIITKPLNASKKLFRRALNKSLLKEKLGLKLGAHVLLTKNLTDTLVNGSKGIVTEFKMGYPVVKFFSFDIPILITEMDLEMNFNYRGNEVKLIRRQIPLILAWAITIHKCQGLTLDCVDICMEDIFEDGQFYVALSRVRDMKGLYLKNFDESKIKTNMEVIEFYNKFF